MKLKVTQKLVFIPIMTILIALCAWITVPSVIPFTMQTFAIFLAFLLLGWKEGSMAVVLYILLGAVGVPVFSGFGGGIGHILGPTGGFLLGFLPMGPIYGLITKIVAKTGKQKKNDASTAPSAEKNIWTSVPGLVIGLVACYVIGMLWYAYVYTGGNGIKGAFLLCVAPYIVPDLIKLFLAIMTSRRVKPYIMR